MVHYAFILKVPSTTGPVERSENVKPDIARQATSAADYCIFEFCISQLLNKFGSVKPLYIPLFDFNTRLVKTPYVTYDMIHIIWVI